MQVISNRFKNNSPNPYRIGMTKKPIEPENIIKAHGFNFNKNSISFYGYTVEPARRLNKSNYAIAEYINEINKARTLYGDQAMIELAMGNPDIIPPQCATDALRKSSHDLWSHRYNYPKGEGSFREGVASWFKKRFDLEINPNTEVMLTSGNSNGISTILSAYTERGDKILVPNPGYALYDDLVARHDLKKVSMNLDPKNDYLPDFEKIKKEDIKDVKCMIINYPHNPTGSFASLEFYEKAVKFAKDNNIFIIHDFDNSEITHHGDKPIGILQAKGANDVAFEVHTLSKAHNMPGLRVGFVVSNKEFIDNTYKAKLLSNNSVYTAIQAAATAALEDKEEYIEKVNQEHRNRKNIAIERLKKLGSDAQPTKGTYYLWVKVPGGFSSDEFYKYVLHKAHVAITPGTVFGSKGEGFVRFVMSANTDDINKAFDHIEKAGIRFDKKKKDLPKEVQEEIQKIAKGDINIIPKAVRDLENYKKMLLEKREMLKERLNGKSANLQRFLPDKNSIESLPVNILKPSQKVYLHDSTSVKPCLGEIREISPYSNPSYYKNIKNCIKNTWIPYAKKHNPNAEILEAYKNGKFYEDATYVTLWANGELQAIGNVEAQNDGCLWGRGLNTAPWNQGETPKIKGAGTAILMRRLALCLETGNSTFKIATKNKQLIDYYQRLGMQKNEIKSFSGVDYQVLSIDKEGMKKALKTYQKYLSY